jgi:hypothetical protein
VLTERESTVALWFKQALLLHVSVTNRTMCSTVQIALPAPTMSNMILLEKAREQLGRAPQRGVVYDDAIEFTALDWTYSECLEADVVDVVRQLLQCIAHPRTLFLSAAPLTRCIINPFVLWASGYTRQLTCHICMSKEEWFWNALGCFKCLASCSFDFEPQVQVPTLFNGVLMYTSALHTMLRVGYSPCIKPFVLSFSSSDPSAPHIGQLEVEAITQVLATQPMQVQFGPRLTVTILSSSESV